MPDKYKTVTTVKTLYDEVLFSKRLTVTVKNYAKYEQIRSEAERIAIEHNEQLPKRYIGSRRTAILRALVDGRQFRYLALCPICETLFTQSNLTGKHRNSCSPTCAAKLRSRRQSEKRKAERRAAVTERSCDYCGEVYQPKRTTSQFCSSYCRLAAHREKE